MDPPIYDSSDKTLTLMSNQNGISIKDLHNIHFGNSKKGDVDLCMTSSKNRYHILNKDKVDLSGPTATMTLFTQSLYPNLTLTLSMKKNDMIHVKWNYEDPSKHRAVFEVP